MISGNCLNDFKKFEPSTVAIELNSAISNFHSLIIPLVGFLTFSEF
jgi:hypothetical protein